MGRGTFEGLGVRASVSRQQKVTETSWLGGYLAASIGRVHSVCWEEELREEGLEEVRLEAAVTKVQAVTSWQLGYPREDLSLGYITIQS